MLYLSKTESLIIETLKTWPKNSLQIEEAVDHSKEFSRDYVKTMIYRINKKAKRPIIDTTNESGEKRWFLCEEGIQYSIIDHATDAYEELLLVKQLACDTCKHKSNAEFIRKYGHLLVCAGAVSLAVNIVAIVAILALVTRR